LTTPAVAEEKRMTKPIEGPFNYCEKKSAQEQKGGEFPTTHLIEEGSFKGEGYDLLLRGGKEFP